MAIAKIRMVRSLLRLGAFLQREGTRIVKAFDLNQQQFVVLKEIEEKGPLSQRDICSGLLFEKSNISKMVKKLAKAGLVSMIQSPLDGRLSLLQVSDKGKRVVSECMGMLDHWNKKWLDSLSREDVAAALRVLEKLEEHAH
jgi:DNA-binding MarR family transcriptional regulator